MLSLLQRTDRIVSSLLSEFGIGDYCDIEAQTDAFTYTFAYLLIWTEILEFFANISDQMHPLYAEFLRQTTYLPRLMETLFRLMPLSVKDINRVVSADLFDTRMTTNTEFVCLDEPSDSSHIHRLSSHLYYLLLRRMPASVRQWYKNCDKNTSELVNEYANHWLTRTQSNLCFRSSDSLRITSVQFSYRKNWNLFRGRTLRRSSATLS